ncbi:hypothetical protein [Anaerotignum sp.]
MIQNGMYFGKDSFYQMIRSLGGEWNDSKERPLVCLLKSNENDDLFWAIPVGNWDHRDEKAKKRIQSFLSRPDDNIGSCFYHLGNTNVKSIFFISDAVPITASHIEREYLDRHTKKIYIIKNKKLLAELERKLRRILSWENSNPNFFRQHITDIKNHLLQELLQKK